MLFYISLFSGRTDNVYLEANSKNDVLNFFSTVSDAKVKTIKEVVYSKIHLIGTVSGALATAPVTNKRDIKAMIKTKNFTNIIDLKFIKSGLSKSIIETNIKKYLLLNDEKVESILSLMEHENE
jgi:hypothetical protein